jgi:predicted ribosome quality control (RQC) complex YloA/Tae2 family protein
MTLSTAEIATVVADLKPKIEGGRIERIDQPDQHRLVLRVRNHGACYWLQFCVHPRFSRLHLLTGRPAEGTPAAGFCKVVREHLTGAPLLALRQLRGDRVVAVESRERDQLMHPHKVRLVAELVGVGSNLILLDESDRILAVLFRERSQRRELAPGKQYVPLEPPESPPDQAFANRFEDAAEQDDPLALSRAIHAAYAGEEAEDEIGSVREELIAELRDEVGRRRRRLEHIEDEIERAENAETVRRRGELLKLALPRLERGREEVRVEDLFEPDGGEVTIELDPALTPEENLQRIFEDYKKAKAGHEKLLRRAQQTEREIEALQAVMEEAEAGETVEGLRNLKAEARESGLLPPPQPERPARGKKRRGPRRFESAEGLEILVARNSKENDKLTFTIANGNDYWLHVLGWPGPHVIVRKPKDKAVSPESLLDAAHLAIHFSKIRGTDYAEVVYTQRKHVRRLKGGSGKVNYANSKTLQVRLQRHRLERLLHSGAAS